MDYDYVTEVKIRENNVEAVIGLGESLLKVRAAGSALTASGFCVSFDFRGANVTIDFSDRIRVAFGGWETPLEISSEHFTSLIPATALRFLAVNAVARKPWALRALAILSCFSTRTVQKHLMSMCNEYLDGTSSAIGKFCRNLSEYITNPRTISRAISSLKVQLDAHNKKAVVGAFLKLLGDVDHPRARDLLLETTLSELIER